MEIPPHIIGTIQPVQSPYWQPAGTLNYQPIPTIRPPTIDERLDKIERDIAEIKRTLETIKWRV